MNLTAILIGLIPLIGWGFYPTVVSKIGGKPANQLLGSTIGTVFFGFIFLLITKTPILSLKGFIIAILSGMGWSLGQIAAFKSYQLVGSSITMPISTALQLVYISLWGVIVLGNWNSTAGKIIGFGALIVMILGAYLTSWSEHPAKSNKKALKKAIILMVFGTLGNLTYSVLPQTAQIKANDAFFPQTIGMLLVAILYGLIILKKNNIFNAKVSYKQIISGFFFALAALSYLISSQPNMNGVATGFVLSQTSVILATLSSIYMLKQYKTKKEMAFTWTGLLLIVIAASFTAFIK